MPSESKEKQREYDAKRAGRTRNYTTIMYPEDLPDDWRDKLDETHIKWIESPLHDKDVNPDGTPKKAHHHILLMFGCVKSLGQVSDLLADVFGLSPTGSIIGVAVPQAVSDRCALIRYFAHMDHPSKAQYDIADIVGHNGADPAEIMRYSQSETLSMMIDIEKYIESNHIMELCDLSAAIRETHPEWYVIISTRSTVYFNAFIRSYRHKMKNSREPEELAELCRRIASGAVRVDEQTGEIVEGVKIDEKG